jgi:hypothetical protein
LEARKLIAKSFRDIIMPQVDGEDMSPAKPVVDAWANPLAQTLPSSLGGRLAKNRLDGRSAFRYELPRRIS